MKTPWKIAVLLSLSALCLTGCIKPDKEIITVKMYRIEIPAVQPTPVILEILANCMWSIETTDTWFNVSPFTAYGDKNVEISASTNTSLTSRTARFFIVGKTARQEVEVIQRGEDPTITFKNNPVTISADGGEIEVEVSTNVEMNLSINVPWVTFVATKLESSFSYTFQVKPNTDLEDRTAKVSFSQKGGSLNKDLTINQLGETPAISLSKTAVSVEAAGGEMHIVVSANIPWSTVCADDWVLMPNMLQTKLMEDDFCHFYVAPNPRVESRETTLIFSGTGAKSQTLLINQTGTEAAVTCIPAQYDNIPAIASATQYKIEVHANFNWTVDHSQTDSWVKDITFDAGSCSFNVLQNTETTTRTTTIVFRETGVPESGAHTCVYAITQLPADAQLFFIPIQADLREMEGGRDSLLVLVTANVPWVAASDQPWVSFEERHINGLDPNTKGFRLIVQENPATDARSANINLVSQDISRTIVVTQKAGPPKLSASPRKIEAPSEGTKQLVTVTSNVNWTRHYTADWVSVVSAPVTKNPLSESMLQITVDVNTSFSVREERIVIKHSETLTDTVHIIQSGITPSIGVSFPKPTASGAGENRFRVDVEANYGVVLLKSSLPNWLRAVDSLSSRWYSFEVDPTPLGIARTAMLSFKNTNGEVEPIRSFPLVQKGATVSVADSTVLVRLYRTTTGAMWTHRWDLNQPVDKWYGVTLSGVMTDENGIPQGELRVLELDLRDERLSGNLGGGLLTAPVVLDELKYLTKLNLSGNLLLTGGLPVDLYKLRYLTELDLSNCSFSNVGSRNIPEEWGGTDAEGAPYFALLKTFKVSRNSLTGIIPLSIRNHVNWDFWDWDRDIKPQKNSVELHLP